MQEDRLTEREKQVLVLLAQDLTAKQIGQQLGITSKTVELHKQAMKKKINVNGTAGLVRYAIRTGLIEP
jgi:DNA-binding CsgD family transcriptional regulator